MSDILEELKKLSAKDARLLDACIAVDLFDEPHGPDDLIYAKVTSPYGPDSYEPGTYWRHSRSGMSLRTAPRYIADAIAELASLRAQLATCRAAALEEAANRAQRSRNETGESEPQFKHGWYAGCAYCSNAIRALAGAGQ